MDPDIRIAVMCFFILGILGLLNRCAVAMYPHKQVKPVEIHQPAIPQPQTFSLKNEVLLEEEKKRALLRAKKAALQARLNAMNDKLEGL